MNIQIDKTLSNAKYSAKITITADEVFKQKALAFGSPSVNVGGSFIGPPDFTLPALYKTITKDFPYTYTMDANADAEAEAKMGVYITTMKDRINTAIDELRAKVDQYTGQEVYTR